MEPVGN